MSGNHHRSGQKVIVPAIDAASSVACMRSLGKRGIRTVAISEQEHPPGFSSKYCDEAITVADPAVDLAAYEDALLALAHRRDIHTIIPVREADIYILARNKKAFSEHVATPWPALETLQRVQDRVHLFDAARTANVPIPETRTIDEWTDWDSDSIVKPRYTVQAPEYCSQFSERHPHQKSTQYIGADTAPDIASIVDEMGHEPLVQEHIPDSDEYAFFALYRHGDPVATFQHRQRRGWKYSGGPSAYRESVDIPELDAAGRRLLDQLDWHGLAMVEFLRDSETGEFKLMEINPRFWTSLPFTVQAGVDFPHLYWQQATGRSIPREPDYDIGVAGHLLRGELLHLYSILREEDPVTERPPFLKTAKDVVSSLVRHRRFDYLDLDDPEPFIRDSRNTATELLSGDEASSRRGKNSSSEQPATSSPSTGSRSETIKTKRP